MATFTSHSAEETVEFGWQIGQCVRAGMVLGLIGDLGAGKTQFVKGVARGLGIRETVLSPTFALVHSYGEGRLPLWHIDFYRLETDEQIIQAGLTEYFESDGVALIEWWDRWHGRRPSRLCQFAFDALSESDRRITYDDPGS